MTFRDVMIKLGVSNPMVVKYTGIEPACRLPFQPFDRIKSVEGCTIRLAQVGMAVFEIPVDEGIARIVGKVQVERDGTQTLLDAIAFLFARDSADAGTNRE